MTILTLNIYAQMRAGNVDQALLSPQMAALLSPEALAKQKSSLDQLGDPKNLTLESHSSSANGIMWKYLANFASAQLHVTIFIGKDGKVAGYTLKP